MAKTQTIQLIVEDVALGGVIRILNSTPGVVSFDLQLDKKGAKKANGSSGPRPRYSDGTGLDLMMTVLAVSKRPTTKQLEAAFSAKGRSTRSINSLLHYFKKAGAIRGVGKGVYEVLPKFKTLHAEAKANAAKIAKAEAKAEAAINKAAS